MPNLKTLIDNGRKSFEKGDYHFYSNVDVYTDLSFAEGSTFSCFEDYKNKIVIKNCRFGDDCTFNVPTLEFKNCRFGKYCKFNNKVNKDKIGSSLTRCDFGEGCTFEKVYVYDSDLNRCSFGLDCHITNNDSNYKVRRCKFAKGSTVTSFCIDPGCVFERDCRITTTRVGHDCEFGNECVFLPFRPEIDPDNPIIFNCYYGNKKLIPDENYTIKFGEGCIFLTPCRFHEVNFTTHIHQFNKRTHFNNCTLNEKRLFSFLFKEYLNILYPPDQTSHDKNFYNIDIYAIPTEDKLFIYGGLSKDYIYKGFAIFSKKSLDYKFPINILYLESSELNYCVNVKKINSVIKHFKKMYKIERKWQTNKF